MVILKQRIMHVFIGVGYPENAKEQKK